MRSLLGLVKSGCHSLMPTLEETEPAFQKFDDDGFLHNIGKCFCTEDLKPMLDPIINAIAEALQKLGDILEKICEGLLETVKQVVDVGIAAIPGGSAVKAVSWGVRAAKTLAENGKTAEDMFGNWVGPVCGDASFKGFDITTAFQQFSEAPDSMGTSTGCFNKKGCKRLPPKKDPPKAPKKPADPPEKPNTNVPDKPPTTDNKPSAIDSRPTTTNDKSPTTTEDKPTTTTTDHPSTTSSTTDSDACKKVEKRAKPGWYEKAKLGDAESSLDCRPSGTTNTPSHKSVRGTWRKLVIITGNRNLKATALDRWGSTAVTTRKGLNQHWWPWAQGWLPRENDKKSAGLCERDEWPPALFWPGDNYANRNNMAQRVRLNPRSHNGPAGNIFKGFCTDNDAITTQGGKTYEIRDNVRTIGVPVVNPPRVANGRASKSRLPILHQRGAPRPKYWADELFEDWDNLPVDNVWYGLRDNPCWPSDLAPNDPGWALLTNDEFYETQHQNLKQYRELYTKPPPLQDLKDALLKRGGQPPYPFSKIKKDKYKEIQFHNPAKKLWHIPDDYVGVLPSLDFPLPIKRNWINDTDDETGNNTVTGSRKVVDMVDIKKMTIQDIHLTEDEDLERMDDAQLDAWMNRYLELLRRQSETSSNTSPPVSDAQPTPAGQADPAPEAASVGSLGFEELPQPTGT
ncbi:uncharacterized protein PG986_008609 [Apiospora aurea]|uniref:Uncharacterized protein n=1 Tax=Apiospora aurea TaxID=335848 RepID=A0ABR1Q5E1_9PEZI